MINYISCDPHPHCPPQSKTHYHNCSQTIDKIFRILEYIQLNKVGKVTL